MKALSLSSVSLAILLASIPPATDAQWVESGPGGGIVYCLAVRDVNLFAATQYGGVFLSTNNGANWTAVNTGLTNLNVYALAVSGTNLFAGGSAGVFLSTNNGTSWTAVNTGLTNLNVSALAVSGTNLFAGGSGGIFLSTNNGTSWTAVNCGGAVGSFAISDSIIIAGIATTPGRVLRSTDHGTTWISVSTWPFHWPYQFVDEPITVTMVRSNAFVSTYGSVDWSMDFQGLLFRSTDGGNLWDRVSTGLPYKAGAPYITAILISDTSVFAGTNGDGIFLSTDNGTSWKPWNSGLMDIRFQSLAVNGTTVFAGTYYGGVYRRALSDILSGVSIYSSDLPHLFNLDQNYPNPFNPTTTIRYSLPQRSHVTLTVFNTLGQKVATLVNGYQDEGYHGAKFDASGLASGVYFYRIQAGNFVQTKKLLLLR